MEFSMDLIIFVVVTCLVIEVCRSVVHVRPEVKLWLMALSCARFVPQVRTHYTLPMGLFSTYGMTRVCSSFSGKFKEFNNAVLCSDCANGSYATEVGSKHCIGCPKGYFCPVYTLQTLEKLLIK